MSDPLSFALEPFDSRIDTVLALLNQRREFARRGAQHLFTRGEIAELLKISGDPWTSALLAELSFARRRAEEIAAQTPYARVVSGLVGATHSRDASLRLMRRAVSRPIESAMRQAQDLLARIQHDKMPLTAAASERLDSQLLALQQAWTLYSDRLLAAYLRLRESQPQAKAPGSASAASQDELKGQFGAAAVSGKTEGQTQAAQEPLRRRRSDQETLLH